MRSVVSRRQAVGEFVFEKNTARFAVGIVTGPGEGRGDYSSPLGLYPFSRESAV